MLLPHIRERRKMGSKVPSRAFARTFQGETVMIYPVLKDPPPNAILLMIFEFQMKHSSYNTGFYWSSTLAGGKRGRNLSYTLFVSQVHIEHSERAINNRLGVATSSIKSLNHL